MDTTFIYPDVTTVRCNTINFAILNIHTGFGIKLIRNNIEIQQKNIMPFILSDQNNEAPVNIYYEDYGKGFPVVFIHGWPLSGSMWEYQVNALLQHDLRCITYDRRGFGRSDHPYDGYDYHTLASDLKAVLDELDLHEVTLVGFSMGGGEIAKYFSLYDGARVAKVVLISSVLPYMLQTADHPEGVPQKAFDEMLNAVSADRPSFIESFNKDFYGMGLMNQPVSDAYLANALTQAMNASPIATAECAKAFSTTDFRQDMASINVPTLIIHGDEDKTVPIKATGELAAKLIPGALFKVYPGAPHGLWFTEKDTLNQDLVDFICDEAIVDHSDQTYLKQVV